MWSIHTHHSCSVYHINFFMYYITSLPTHTPVTMLKSLHDTFDADMESNWRDINQSMRNQIVKM